MSTELSTLTADWQILKEQAKMAVQSGFLPIAINTPEKAVIIALKGRELGIPMMQAFSSISVIKGKPALSSELMLALIYRKYPNAKISFKTPPEKAHEECTIEAQRPHGDIQTFKFSVDDAKRAGLIGTEGSAWHKYPTAMLRARAISGMARALFPECIAGCYTPEEIGGEVIDVEPALPLAEEGKINRDNLEPPRPTVDATSEKTRTWFREVIKKRNWETEARAIMNDTYNVKFVDDLDWGQMNNIVRQLDRLHAK